MRREATQDPGLAAATDRSRTVTLEQCMAQRENMRAIFDSLAEGIFTADRELVVTNANQAFGNIVGMPASECSGQRVCELLRGVEEELEQALLDAVDGRPTRGSELVFLTADRQTRTGVLTAAPLTNPDGEIDGVVAVLRDISEIRRLTEELEGRSSYFRMVGRNPRMRHIYDMVDNLADNDVTVLVQGESGTGKELVAHAIHYRSHRADGPFVRVNCAALAETLLESELFGHAKGSFTGAAKDRIGRFEEANGGTIFMDEVGDVSLPVQQRLLRVIQEREFERVGESHTRHTDVRVIAATHRNLKQLAEAGRFREDLYYRLNVVSIELPPLRERREDIPLLVDHFVAKFNASMQRTVVGVAAEALERLLDYSWPGNVRELENAIQRAMVVARTRTIGVQHLPPEIAEREARPAGGRTEGRMALDGAGERAALLDALNRCGWNKAAAARVLGVDRTTIWRRMKRYGVVGPGR